jgi:hypothetical protein
MRRSTTNGIEHRKARKGSENLSLEHSRTKIPNTSPKIGTLNEKPLHEALKQWYRQDNDRFEVPVDGFVIDIVRGDLLVEIQTKNLSTLKRKLGKLVMKHRVRLVFPIPYEKWIVKPTGFDIETVERRKSPKRGSFVDIFEELVSLPHLILNPNFSIELLLIQEEEIRRYDGVRGWRRRGWLITERRLLKVVEQRVLETWCDFSSFLPADLVNPFTTSDLARALARSKRFARETVYCLRAMGCITNVGKRSRSFLYSRV